MSSDIFGERRLVAEPGYPSADDKRPATADRRTSLVDPERSLAILELGHSNGGRLSYRFCQLTYASVPIASTLGISPISTC